MKFISFLTFVFLLTSCGKSGDTPDDIPPAQDAVVVKTMTYNIWGARQGGLHAPQLQEIAEVIKKHKPDLVALQEVDRFTTRNGQAVGDVAKELATLTGMSHFFALAEPRHGGEYGDAILSNLPIKETKAYNLGVTAELPGEIRSVARVTVEKEGKEFHFISTHFDHLSNEANRLKQAKDFVTILKGYQEPVIVGADFNALPNSETIGILRQHLTLGCFNNNCSQFTFSTDNPRSVIDYMMYAPITGLSVQSYTVDTRAYKESDHFPVISTFKLH
ncbi:endonuclease/exonuclease/phosphatase family protein [Sphingobacterium haloxyli]|uniref:Endonuclease n=1 Tax=Sphingobacterium haloxyli TaxID=2100533 RepID=A0A2S9J4H8_9SPHI|nr:endonuclease/exonuclease/phosphatase family protein [Sphingobacterium haloxyli]PRD47662.1 endonuclease [Sphingobacterium haloxyli]